jgi:hypothetical protein
VNGGLRIIRGILWAARHSENFLSGLLRAGLVWGGALFFLSCPLEKGFRDVCCRNIQ